MLVIQNFLSEERSPENNPDLPNPSKNINGKNTKNVSTNKNQTDISTKWQHKGAMRSHMVEDNIENWSKKYLLVLIINRQYFNFA